MFEKLRYCSVCNYAMSIVSIEQARFDYDCPHCRVGKISEYYSYGSPTHKERSLFNNRSIKAPPFPKDVSQKQL